MDYQIPMAEVEKAGISSTGSPIDNELVLLAQDFYLYRKELTIWNPQLRRFNYELDNEGTFYRISVLDNKVQEKEILYER